MPVRELNKQQQKQVKRVRKVILKEMKKRDLPVMGNLRYLDQRESVMIYADVLKGKELQNIWWEPTVLKVGNIVQGRFVCEKDKIFEL